MRPRDFGLLSLVCLIWGLNFVITKWIVSGDGPGAAYSGAPPFFAAAARFLALALVLAPLLRPIPKGLGAVALVATLMGTLNFGLLFVGVKYSNPSAVAVAVLLAPVFTTALAIPMLGERVGWRRGLGMALALAGVGLVALQPEAATAGWGMLLVIAGTLAAAAGNVLLKRLPAIGPWRLQAWMGAVSFAPLALISLIFERAQAEALATGGWRLALAFVYVTALVSLVGFRVFIDLMRRYDASLVTTLTLMAPLWGITFGVLLAGDPLTWRLLVGGAVAVAGVAVVAWRTKTAPTPIAAPSQPDVPPAEEKRP